MNRGASTNLTLRMSIHPMYDPQLLAAAKEWRYKPATVDGTPVKFRKDDPDHRRQALSDRRTPPGSLLAAFSCGLALVDGYLDNLRNLGPAS